MSTKDQQQQCSGVALLSTLDCSSNPVCSIAFSPDGKSIASASADGTIRLWNIDGRVQQTLQGHSESVVAWSLDGSQLVSVSEENPVQLWAVAKGTVLKELRVDSDGFTSVTFSPVGELVLASGDVVEIWNTDDGTMRQKKTFQGYEIPHIPRHNKAPYKMLDGFPIIRTLAFSPQGEFLACGYDGGRIKLWDISQGRAYYLEGHLDDVVDLAFSSDGETMASASDDGKIWLWHVRQVYDKPHDYKLQGRELKDSPATGAIRALSFFNSCSIHAGVINQGSYSVSIYKVAF